MKINDTRKPIYVTFDTLGRGDCFVDADERYCMVIEYDCTDDYNAVDLEDGSLHYFYPSKEVIKINARLEVF